MILKINNSGIIKEPHEMSKQLVFKTAKRVHEQKARDMEIFKDNMCMYTPIQERNLRNGIEKLEKILQSFAPNSIMQYREYDIYDLKRMIKDGHFLYGDRAKVIAGPPGQCHRNSSELWKLNYKNFNVHIETGYALSKDGMWYQHSWLVLFNKKNQIEVIETTPLRRIAYYGFQMTHKEAVKFYNDHH